MYTFPNFQLMYPYWLLSIVSSLWIQRGPIIILLYQEQCFCSFWSFLFFSTELYKTNNIAKARTTLHNNFYLDIWLPGYGYSRSFSNLKCHLHWERFLQKCSWSGRVTCKRRSQLSAAWKRLFSCSLSWGPQGCKIDPFCLHVARANTGKEILAIGSRNPLTVLVFAWWNWDGGGIPASINSG